MKTAFTVVAEEEPRYDYHVRSMGWSTGKGAWHPTEEAARADAAKRSKRKITPRKGMDPYQYDYTVTHFPPGEQTSRRITIFRNGEEEPAENYDAHGRHKTDPSYDPSRPL